MSSAVAGTTVEAEEGLQIVPVKMNDGEILRRLRASHELQNREMGAGGNCLFLSIAPQVEASDVAALPSRGDTWTSMFGEDLEERWQALSNAQRAKLLRQIAILDERDFLAEVEAHREQGEALSSEQHWRMMELYKDMAEEFISTGKTELAEGVPTWNLQACYERVRKLVRDTPREEVYAFILKHAEQYLRTTGRDGNWAGSSEMVALANALERPFYAYGNNWVSQEAIDVIVAADADPSDATSAGKIRPFFAAHVDPDVARGPPVLVFQTNGGGHYQMLAPAE